MEKINNMELENISGGEIWRLTNNQVIKLIKAGFLVTARVGFDRDGVQVEGYAVANNFMQRRTADRNAIYRILRERPEILLERSDLNFIGSNMRENH